MTADCSEFSEDAATRFTAYGYRSNYIEMVTHGLLSESSEVWKC
ncbi:hypothetical protein D1BOALGB6SA_10421 [Olavius sp. associated proteobacterium Delta 1]|nr:hypothetical protein D1BOALGB6SA_10421 [Olavius sp. associated proteobacterium Delta 1]